VSPRVFYERVVLIDDPKNNKFYVFTTSIPEIHIKDVEPLIVSDQTDNKKNSDVIAETLFSC